MSQVTIAPTTKTTVNTTSNISFYCYVRLSETEQIIVEKEIVNGNWVNGFFVSQPTGVMEKFRLEQLIYVGYGEGGNANQKGVYLERIVLRGFRKDGAIKYRDITFFCNSPALDKVLPQIPDQYHDYARKAFAEQSIKLQKELSTLINEGVKIG